MMRSRFAFVMLGALALAACGQGQVVVTAEMEVPNPDGEGMVLRPIADTELQLIPFDRDAVFDSLAQAFPTPEPPIPEDLLAAQEAISAAQEEWRAAEAQWATRRDRLQAITDEMEGLSRGESRYVALFREFQDVESQLGRVERQKDQAFARFTELQEGYISRADSMRLIQEQWADEAFAPVNDVFALKLRGSGREIMFDTTDAAGAAAFTPVAKGQWWVHARHELPFSILYWNIPVTVDSNEPITIQLTPANAERRPKL